MESCGVETATVTDDGRRGVYAVIGGKNKCVSCFNKLKLSQNVNDICYTLWPSTDRLNDHSNIIQYPLVVRGMAF